MPYMPPPAGRQPATSTFPGSPVMTANQDDVLLRPMPLNPHDPMQGQAQGDHMMPGQEQAAGPVGGPGDAPDAMDEQQAGAGIMRAAHDLVKARTEMLRAGLSALMKELSTGTAGANHARFGGEPNNKDD